MSGRGGDIEDLVGMALDDARKACKEGKFTVNGVTITSLRVKLKDGTPLLGTCDFREDRVNVDVDYGVVTKIRGVQ